jgi:hypothetical protein
MLGALPVWMCVGLILKIGLEFKEPILDYFAPPTETKRKSFITFRWRCNVQSYLGFLVLLDSERERHLASHENQKLSMTQVRICDIGQYWNILK